MYGFTKMKVAIGTTVWYNHEGRNILNSFVYDESYPWEREMLEKGLLHLHPDHVPLNSQLSLEV